MFDKFNLIIKKIVKFYYPKKPLYKFYDYCSLKNIKVWLYCLITINGMCAILINYIINNELLSCLKTM